uniref:Uncharacterized protein n=1 Tax=Rhizophora mucronata TaxID=61149 RepID=A0A2P2MDN5_RHIMU
MSQHPNMSSCFFLGSNQAHLSIQCSSLHQQLFSRPLRLNAVARLHFFFFPVIEMNPLPLQLIRVSLSLTCLQHLWTLEGR